MFRSLPLSFSLLIACSAAFAKPAKPAPPAATVAPAEPAAPAAEPFLPEADDPAPSAEAGLAPVSARHLAFKFSCIRAFAGEGGAPQANPAVFDRSCTFHAWDRTEYELTPDDPDASEDEHHMRVFTYTKTGADTATVRCWEGVEYDDGRDPQGVFFEIRLTFTSEKGGTAVFAIGGQSCENYGCGTFTLRR